MLLLEEKDISRPAFFGFSGVTTTAEGRRFDGVVDMTRFLVETGVNASVIIAGVEVETATMAVTVAAATLRLVLVDGRGADTVVVVGC